MIDVLYCLLALLFRRKIKIDVRPLAPVFAQKAFKQQFHADRVNRRDFERVADRRIRSTATSLDENVMLFAKLHNVPNDQKISFETQLRNQRELVFNLLLRAFQKLRIAHGSITAKHALVNSLAQEAIHRIAVWDGVAGELITQIVQLELQAGGEINGIGCCSPNVTEQSHHFAGRAKIALAIVREKTARMVEFRMIANCRKKVQHLAVICCGVPDTVGRNDRQLHRPGDAKRRLVPPLLFALMMSLQFNIDIPGAEDMHQMFGRLAAGLLSTAHQRGGQGPLIASGQAHQTGGVLLKIAEGCCALLLSWRSHLELRY